VCQRVAPVGIQCVDCVKEARLAQRPTRSRLGFKTAAGPPRVTIGLIVVNVAIYLYGTTLADGELFSRLALWPHYDVLNPYYWAGTEWWRWISSGFIHLGALHIGMNMLVLYVFGRELEPLLGRARFALIYGVSLLGASALVVLLSPQNHPTGGASGAVYGLVAAIIVISLSLRLPVQSLVLQAGAWLIVGFFIPGLSWQSHLGGALFGWLVTALMLRLARRQEGRRARRA
jgi:membrane associated rhomboid family serine protease